MFTNKENITNQAVASHNKQAVAFFQPKLTVNQPNDIYEQQADAMADRVMQPGSPVSLPGFFKPAGNPAQRKCQACKGEEDKHVHRKENPNDNARGGNGLDSYVSTLNSGGQQMPERSRKFFEPRFGYDFSNVRLHTDTVAAKSAQSINALAYTTGNNIVFNNNQFSPDSDSGKKLMAHELTHVVQQQGGVNLKRIQKAPGDKAFQPVNEINSHTKETITNAPDPKWNKDFSWDSKFTVVYNLNAKRVTIVSRLFSTATDSLKTGWKTAIEDRWGKGQFNLEAWEGCEPKVFPIDVDIQWVSDAKNAHYSITPRDPGPTPGTSGVGGTRNMTEWGTGSPADVPHEYGHMLGNPEEYYTTNGIDYTYGGTKSGYRDYRGGIMNNPNEAPFPKHYELVRQGFANMMPYPLDRVRVVQTGTYNPPLLNCGDGPKSPNAIA